MSGINLLPSTVLRERAQRRRRTIWSRSLIVYCAMILCGLLVAEGAFIEPMGALEAEQAGLDADIAAAEARAALLQTRESELVAELRVLGEIYGQPDWSVLLAHLGEHLGEGASLRSVHVSLARRSGETMTPGDLARGPYRIELTGVARDQSDVTTFVLSLERAGLLDSVLLKGTSPTRIDRGTGVLFSVSAAISSEEQ